MMTAQEFVAKIAPIDLDRLSTLFHHLADHVGELRLAHGQRLSDATDFRAFLYEIVVALDARAGNPRNPPMGSIKLEKEMQSRWESTCLKCGHVHERQGECGVSMGRGGYCDCKEEAFA